MNSAKIFDVKAFELAKLKAQINSHERENREFRDIIKLNDERIVSLEDDIYDFEDKLQKSKNQLRDQSQRLNEAAKEVKEEKARTLRIVDMGKTKCRRHDDKIEFLRSQVERESKKNKLSNIVMSLSVAANFSMVLFFIVLPAVS